MSAPVCTIAVIVPVHNAAKYLPDCLDAIAAQQFDDFCCVLVDDGSRDESPLLCDNMAAGDARFTVIHQPQRGVSAARTAGLRRALEIGAVLRQVLDGFE
jgi:glycosyltransferase involved in cell wall biosynthesis